MKIFDVISGKTRREQAEREMSSAFNRAFGFSLVKLEEAMRWEQLAVDKKLAEYAKVFHLACEKQENLIKSGGEGKTAIDYRNELFQEAMKLDSAKKQFWAAHAIAKKVGFSVKEKYADYLTSK